MRSVTIWLMATLVLVGGSALADDSSDHIENWLDERGDRIDGRLDRRGNRINDRWDRRSERASDVGRDGPPKSLDQRKSRVSPADQQGNRVGCRINRRSNRRLNNGINHGGSRANLGTKHPTGLAPNQNGSNQ